MVMVLGLMGSAIMAEDLAVTYDDYEEEYLAAPAVAGLLLEEAGIDNRYGKGRDGGNFIADVARHMEPETDFDGIEKTDVYAYEKAIALFLRGNGADVGADLFKAELESVVYEGTCDMFGSHIDDKITFTFSNDIFHNPDIVIELETSQNLEEGWGADDWTFEGNTATVKLNRLYSNSRDMVDNKVMDIKGMVDFIDEPVVVPDGGVQIEVISTGTGIVNADNSAATWTDNGDGTGTMTLTVLDCCGYGIEGLTMDDIAIKNFHDQWWNLANKDATTPWSITLSNSADGVYTFEFDRPTNTDDSRTWDVAVNVTLDGMELESGVIVEEGLAVPVSGN